MKFPCDTATVSSPRLRAHWVAVLVGACTLCLHAAASSQARRPLTVDDVLRMENFGRAELAFDGTLVVYEWAPAYEQAPNLEAVHHPGAFGPMFKLYTVEVKGQGKPQPLFEQDPRGGYWIGALSPAHTRVAIYSLIDRKLRAGVFDLASRRLTWFSFTPNYFWLQQHPVWISEEELVYPALPPGEIPSGILRPAVTAHYNALWQKAFEGREPSATVLESQASGIEQAEVYRSGQLVRVNARTGDISVLDEGYFYKLRLSPDGRYLAALRQGGLIQPSPSRHWNGPHHELLVYDLRSRTRLVPCEACSLQEGGLLQWSAHGRRLAFAARPLRGNIETQESWQYWPATGALKRIPTSGLLSSCGITPIPVGSGEAIAVFSLPLGQEDISPASPCPTQEGTRWDWYLIDADGKPVNLTASFRDVHADFLRSNAPLGVAGESLFILADGNVWRLDVNGDREQLTRKLRGSPEPWVLGVAGSGVYSEEVAFMGSPVPTTHAMLQTADEVLALDLKHGTLKRIRRPSPDAKLLAVTDAASAAVFRSDSSAGTRLLAASGRSQPKTLVTINAYLSEIVAARRAQIRYEFENTHLTSCMLLPPDWKPGRRSPMVVWLYPFARSAHSCESGEVDELSPSSFELLAARGYIVLFAANPKPLLRTPESPLGQLAPVVLAAVDQAIREGYTDANQVGLYGWSQGHHAVLQVLTQTDRFKAAVIGNGISNALSHYGSLPLHQRMLPEPFGFGNPERYELASGPNGLGAKPWEDPMRFVHNSPVLHADRIQTPLLIMHSDFDQFPLEQSEQVFSALYRLRKEAMYVTYWGEPHGLISPANIRDMWQRMFDWYERHLVAPSSPEAKN